MRAVTCLWSLLSVLSWSLSYGDQGKIPSKTRSGIFRLGAVPHGFDWSCLQVKSVGSRSLGMCFRSDAVCKALSKEQFDGAACRQQKKAVAFSFFNKLDEKFESLEFADSPSCEVFRQLQLKNKDLNRISKCTYVGEAFPRWVTEKFKPRAVPPGKSWACHGIRFGSGVQNITTTSCFRDPSECEHFRSRDFGQNVEVSETCFERSKAWAFTFVDRLTMRWKGMVNATEEHCAQARRLEISKAQETNGQEIGFVSKCKEVGMTKNRYWGKSFLVVTPDPNPMLF